MKYKDILDRTRLVEDILGGTVCLAIVKNNLGDGIVEVAESRELSEKEIMKTIFLLSKSFLESKNETSHTFHNTKIKITITVKRSNEPLE